MRTFAAMDGCMKRNQVRILTMYLPVQYTGGRCLFKPRYLFFFFLGGPADSPLSRYCNTIYMDAEHDNEIRHSTTLDLAIDAIEHFRPSQLSDALPLSERKYISH